ncbi:fungal-specific transcription factor domain-containing protein [Trichoderma aethiopicum]
MATEAPMNSAQGSGDGQGSVVSSWSCFNCRRRKARCNRQSPCTFCSKAGVECSYPFTGRMPTRQHNPTTASVTSVQARPPRKRSELQVQELLERLRQLESVVDEMKGQDKKDTPHYNRWGHAKDDPNSGAEADSTTGDSGTTESCSDLSHQLSKTFGSLHVCEGGTLYTSNGFWAALHGELKNVRQAFETNDVVDHNGFDHNPSVHDGEADPMPFPFTQSDSSDFILHPAPSLMPFLWKTYVENVDPFIKVLHVPSLNKVIQQSEGRFDELSPGMRALLFSISLAAVVSMSDADVQKKFGDAKEDVLAHFVMGTEKALSEAGILKSTDLCIAQATLIYLESAGHRYGMRTVWMMSGILVRAAMSVGLHRDGVAFPNMSCFEAEMRRRLWWHICCFDARISQCYAPEIMITNSMLDTKEPANCNDADLDVNMQKGPVAREGFTDVSFTLMMCELRRLHVHVLSSMSALLDTGEKQQAARRNALRRIEQARDWAKIKVVEHSGQKRPIQAFMDFLFNMLLNHLGIIVRDTNVFAKE